MKKRMLFMFVVLLSAILTVSFFTSPAIAADEKSNTAPENKVLVSDEADSVRFLNMLNHNFVYDGDFDSCDDIINNSILALLRFRSTDDEDYISEDIVKGFVYDMYGIDVIDMSALNAEYPKKPGSVYIIPRGYTTYRHTMDSIVWNEDGSALVTTYLTVNYHDGESETLKAISLFVKNEKSSFGYNIVYSNILCDNNQI